MLNPPPAPHTEVCGPCLQWSLSGGLAGHPRHSSIHFSIRKTSCPCRVPHLAPEEPQRGCLVSVLTESSCCENRASNTAVGGHSVCPADAAVTQASHPASSALGLCPAWPAWSAQWDFGRRWRGLLLWAGVCKSANCPRLGWRVTHFSLGQNNQGTQKAVSFPCGQPGTVPQLAKLSSASGWWRSQAWKVCVCKVRFLGCSGYFGAGGFPLGMLSAWPCPWDLVTREQCPVSLICS